MPLPTSCIPGTPSSSAASPAAKLGGVLNWRPWRATTYPSSTTRRGERCGWTEGKRAPTPWPRAPGTPTTGRPSSSRVTPALFPSSKLSVPVAETNGWQLLPHPRSRALAANEPGRSRCDDSFLSTTPRGRAGGWRGPSALPKNRHGSRRGSSPCPPTQPAPRPVGEDFYPPWITLSPPLIGGYPSVATRRTRLESGSLRATENLLPVPPKVVPMPRGQGAESPSGVEA